MTQRSTETDFSYRLTESLLSQTPNSSLSSNGGHRHYLKQQHHNSLTPQLVSPLPSNAMVVQPRDSSSSFNHYINDYFKQDAPVLLDRLSTPSPQNKQVTGQNQSATTPSPTSAFWAYLSNDLDSKPPAPALSEISANSIDRENEKYVQPTWEEEESTFFSVGAFLFLFGFIVPPLWWIGSFIPRSKRDCSSKMVERWRLLNRYFSLGFSSLLIIAIIILAVIYSVMY
ncbi:hypothetical protein K501DRAFT_303862 [Backusella circina FSU 941]|nr:hypothetical protein K501DRAFT_303862 [Backusella circina FSU 941]